MEGMMNGRKDEWKDGWTGRIYGWIYFWTGRMDVVCYLSHGADDVFVLFR